MGHTEEDQSNIKKVKFAYQGSERHWVGNGFYVHGLLRPSEELNKHISPFILMDYAPAKNFSPTDQRRGVGEHPHRGFETVTFSYQGEVEHRDSAGGGGVIKPGDVQWMTAGRGVVHDEFHSEAFSSKGGTFEMVQLWVNLPKEYKMTTPKYQSIMSEQIPSAEIGDSTQLRVIAGALDDYQGPASTFTPINIYDISSASQDALSLPLKTATNTIMLIMSGEIKVDNQNYPEHSLLIFEQGGESIDFTASENFKGLLLNGAPIDEPVVAYGPFVMNTKKEVSDAMTDYQNGSMGKL